VWQQVIDLAGVAPLVSEPERVAAVADQDLLLAQFARGVMI
jgi:hypothetical protein